jgi:hypothetical protein
MKRILTLLLLAVILVACSSPGPTTPAPRVVATQAVPVVTLAPGDSLTVNCPNVLSYVASSPASWVITCLADTPTATSTDTATPTPTSTETAAPTSTPTATPSPTPSNTATPTPSAAPTLVACSSGYPFGPMGLPTSLLGNTYSGSALSADSYLPASASYILKALDAARAAHARLFLSLQAGAQLWKNADGSFNLALWKVQIDHYNAIDLSSYLIDGTLAGTLILDEPSDRSNWGGHLPSDSDLDAAAGYIQSKHAGLRAFIGSHMDYILARGYAWQNLKAIMEPFTWRNAPAPAHDVMAYMDAETALARAHGFTILTNINGPDGGVSGGPLTPAQLLAWGSHAINLSYSSGTFIWAWTTPNWLVPGSWFNQPTIAPVMVQLEAQALARSGCPSS